tara:strand:- start:567 stop:929 length:363 start_codon:yes stop_codon:yes gene_type:complete
MRKIERQMIQAITNRQTWSNNNTRVVLWSGSPITTDPNHNKEEMRVYLHGHHIASYNTKDMSLKVNNCGYATNTTKSRLNALINFVADPTKNGIHQKNWEWYIRINGDTHSFPDNEWVSV